MSPVHRPSTFVVCTIRETPGDIVHTTTLLTDNLEDLIIWARTQKIQTDCAEVFGNVVEADTMVTCIICLGLLCTSR